MLDVAGFDAEVPRVVEAFSRGAFWIGLYVGQLLWRDQKYDTVLCAFNPFVTLSTKADINFVHFLNNLP
jgi:hypothetical protein